MDFNALTQGDILDLSIIGVYLLITLAVGSWFGRKVDSMKEDAIGNRDFATAIVVMTMIATIFGAGSTLGHSEKAFSLGITYAAANLGFPIGWWLVSRYIAPRMVRFHSQNMLSVGEMMGSLYGKPGRIITGIAATLSCTAVCGAQIAALGYVCHYLLGMPQAYSIWAACGITAFYSGFGGIRSVTATDVVQFLVLLCGLPLLCDYAVFELGGHEGYTKLFTSIPQTNMTLFPTKESFWEYFPLFFVFCLPSLLPADVQRLLMTRNTKQAVTMIRITALSSLTLLILASLLGFV
ncbi:MAG: hypothetical protein AAF320_00070, partial [Myxococcota bacterium]